MISINQTVTIKLKTILYGLCLLLVMGFGVFYLFGNNQRLSFVTQAIRMKTFQYKPSSPVAPETIFSCLSVSEIPQAECEALVKLFDSTNGNYRTNVNGIKRKETNTPCNRYGIRCDAGYSGAPKRVRTIMLNGDPTQLGNNLVGTLPPEMINLTELKTLNLYNNKLEGSIPTWLADLHELESLNLSKNNFVGSIPAELGNVQKLRVLGLSTNKLTGPLPNQLGNLSNLAYFAFDHNQICGRIPESYMNINVLHNGPSFDLKNNNLITDGYSPAMNTRLTILPPPQRLMGGWGTQLPSPAGCDIVPACISLTVTPNGGAAPLNASYVCAGDNSNTYRVTLVSPNGSSSIFGSSVGLFKNLQLGTYSVKCEVKAGSSRVTSPACQTTITVTDDPNTHLECDDVHHQCKYVKGAGSNLNGCTTEGQTCSSVSAAVSCDSLTITPNGGTAPLNATYSCVGSNSINYAIKLTLANGTVFDYTTANGSLPTLFAGVHEIECKVSGISSPACKKLIKVTDSLVPGKCGSSAGSYPFDAISFSAHTQFCEVGTLVGGVNPVFPNVGGSVTWQCAGPGGVLSPVCAATRGIDPLLMCPASVTVQGLPSIGGIVTKDQCPVMSNGTVADSISQTNFAANSTLDPMVYNITCSYPGVGSCPMTVTVAPTILTPVNGSCGPAAHSNYEHDIFPAIYSAALCGAGNGVATPINPVFPNAGSSVTWICGGSNGGSASPTCTASRDSKPECGTAAKQYAAAASSFGNFTLCEAPATAVIAPSFPLPGGSVTRQCKSPHGGAPKSCTATRALAPVDGQCGSAAKTYSHTDLVYVGTKCSAGTQNPAVVGFPAQGSTVQWTCEGANGGTDMDCEASRENPPAIDGVCGPAAKEYAFADPDVYVGVKCSAGTQVPATVGFPLPGQSETWTCAGQFGGETKTCTASQKQAPSFDLILTKTLTSKFSNIYKYKIDVKNEGTVSAKNFTLKDYAPENSVVSYKSFGGVYGPNYRTVTRTIVELKPGETKSYIIELKNLVAQDMINRAELCDYNEPGEQQTFTTNPCNMGPTGDPSENDEGKVVTIYVP